MADGVLRVGAIADVHYGRDAEKRLRPVFEQAARLVDVLLLGGDLTDFGLPEEAQVLARDLTEVVRIPIVAVLGNHDYEAGKEQEVTAVLRDAGIRVLDGDAVEVKGVGIVGVKGFGGGFGRGTLEPWGEAGVKRFVHEAVEEGLKLERALARLHCRSAGPLALLADPRDGGRGAGGDLPVPRLRAAGGAAEPVRGERHLPRPRPPRGRHGQDRGRHPGVQRGALP